MNRLTSLGISMLMAIGLAACSGDTGSPVSPSTLPSGGATTISGTAHTAGATTGLSFGQLSHDEGDGPLEVCVVGTEVCAVADASGHFQLVGDFVGDVQLRFSGSGHNVVVTVHDVQPGQTITVTVTLNGNTGTLDVESRQGEGTERVPLCHVEGNGSYHRIEVSLSARDAHLAHGDGEPDGPVPDTDEQLTFDANCEIVGLEIDIEKSTNGVDADERPGPLVLFDSLITWTYVVVNTGVVPLSQVAVTDSVEGPIDCPVETLAPGAEMTCTATGRAVAGQYTNRGTVTAFFEELSVTDSDTSHYIGEDEAEEPEDDKKVQLCHRTGNGSYRLIEVSIDAEPAHMAHGDGRPGEGQFDATCAVAPSD